jgi:hypothetical protein
MAFAKLSEICRFFGGVPQGSSLDPLLSPVDVGTSQEVSLVAELIVVLVVGGVRVTCGGGGAGAVSPPPLSAVGVRYGQWSKFGVSIRRWHVTTRVENNRMILSETED